MEIPFALFDIETKNANPKLWVLTLTVERSHNHNNLRGSKNPVKWFYNILLSYLHDL